VNDDAPRRGDRAFPPTRKSLGQHFLNDRRILGRIADALRLQGGETVV
jgi:16S rRNA A1518/A1519 N6-dimethyltransferase RsmA/KsgA/DIM1 with predicted DNA glycosylase/AP lyase activity